MKKKWEEVMSNMNYHNNQNPYFIPSYLYGDYRSYQIPYWVRYTPYYWRQVMDLKDYGPNPFVVNIEEATKANNNFRTALWTGSHLQVTLMSIEVGGEIGLEVHPELDQFIRIEEGQGLVMMGDRKDQLNFRQNVYDNFAFIIPAGKWHNLINTGNKPIKLYSIYAPVQHPYGTVHKTKAEADAAEGR
jgi:mannose-6-phosphate isomerase-like protein (cupin superfamily)